MTYTELLLLKQFEHIPDHILGDLLDMNHYKEESDSDVIYREGVHVPPVRNNKTN